MDETKSFKKPPLTCRKLKCNLLNHNTAIILYNKTCYFYNLPILVTVLVMWLFGLAGLIIGMQIGIFELAAVLCCIFALLGTFVITNLCILSLFT